jgi:hypothetical protein
MTRTTRIFTVLAVGLVALAALGGCARNRLVGTWEHTAGGASGTTEFRTDGTFRTTLTVMGQELVTTGTYRLEGDTLKSVTTRFEAPGMPAALMGTLEGLLAPTMNQEISSPLVWRGNDEFTATIQGMEVVHRRQR